MYCCMVLWGKADGDEDFCDTSFRAQALVFGRFVFLDILVLLETESPGLRYLKNIANLRCV